MCNPAMASLGTQAAGLGMSTVGAFYAAKTEKDNLKYQASIAEINAKIADSNARAEVQRGNWQESQIKLSAAQLKSAQTARMAANGIDIGGSVTAQAVLTGTDVISEVDANQARANAIRAAFGQRMEAGNQRRNAASLRASAAGISPGMAAFTSLVSGAGKVASSWYALNKEGAFSPDQSRAGTATVEAGSNSLVAPPPPANRRKTSSFYDFETSDSILKWAW